MYGPTAIAFVVGVLVGGVAVLGLCALFTSSQEPPPPDASDPANPRRHLALTLRDKRTFTDWSGQEWTEYAAYPREDVNS